MGDDIAIRVEGLGKKYVLNRQAPRGHKNYTALRDVIAEKLLSPFRLLKGGGDGKVATREDFWAVKDLSFEIKKGESVAIIGRNGAGKSTLLKLLSRITHPTTGRIELNGRISSLLEVGTGFHPELSGRENIYLNGAILGMRKHEIKRKFDEIVAFAEVERFLDTPVKRYSSGMYVRLAFAVAAHLEPEILVVDEVLAVGDAQFQKKCLGKMGEVSKEGRTVLFVSHNMAAVESLTSTGIFLSKGSLAFQGPIRGAVTRYFDEGASIDSNLETSTHRTGTGEVKFVSVKTENQLGKETSFFRPTEEITVTLELDFKVETNLELGVVFETQKEQPLFTTHLSDADSTVRRYPPGRHRFRFTIPSNPLRQGSYSVSLAASSRDKNTFFDVILHLPLIEIEGQGILWTVPSDERWGDLYLPMKWEHC